MNSDKTLINITNSLQAFSLSNNFWQAIDTAFGTTYNRTIAELLRGKWQKGDLSDLPPIQIVDSAVLSGGKGAYSQEENRIYLSSNLIGNVEAINKVIMEEIGHYVDAQINQVDSPGDEGAIFAALVQSQNMDMKNLRVLKAEDDYSIITLNGQKIKVENASNTAPIYLQYTLNSTTLKTTDTLSINSGWVYDADGSTDLSRVDFWLKKNDGTFLNLGDVTSFTPYEKDARWGGFNYNLSLSALNLTPGNYSLHGRAYDKSGATSNKIEADFTIESAANNLITLAVSPSRVQEDGRTNLVYTFTRTGNTANALTVNYDITGTADSSDYKGATPGSRKTITFAAGSNKATLTIEPTVDTTVENDETIILTLAAGSGYTIGTTSGVIGTIINDDLPSITLAVSPEKVKEDGASDLIYTFTRTGVISSSLTVNYTVGGEAILGKDYTGITGARTTKTVTFAANSSTTTVTVDPVVDTRIEGDKTVILTLASGEGYTIGTTGKVIGTIINDDFPSIELAVSRDVTEDGTSDLTYTFTRTGIGAISSPLTVNYTVGGTATLGTDYTGITGEGTTKTVTFSANSSTARVTVDPTPDTTIESDETVVLTLASGDGYTIGTTGGVIGTITNDDLIRDDRPLIKLAVSRDVTEDGTSDLTYTFTRTGVISSPLTVNYTVGGEATLGTDYTGIPREGTTKTVTFSANSSTARVTVDPTPDTTIESNETVVLTLASGDGYTIGTTGGVIGTIINDDLPSITLAVSPEKVTEDGASDLLTYTFTRTGVISSPLTVNYKVDGTATLGTDYTGIPREGTTKTVTFAANSSTARVTVDPTPDNTQEPDETVVLTLDSGAGYTIGTKSKVTGTITNDDLSQTIPINGKLGDIIKIEMPNKQEFALHSLPTPSVGKLIDQDGEDAKQGQGQKYEALYYVPVVNGEPQIYVPEVNGEPQIYGKKRNGDPGLSRVSFNVKDQAQKSITVEVEVTDGFSTPVNFVEKPDEKQKRLVIYALEQRLAYLGFPARNTKEFPQKLTEKEKDEWKSKLKEGEWKDKIASPITVDGKNTNNDFTWASNLFYAVVNNSKVGSLQYAELKNSKNFKYFINASNAPRWNEIRNDTIVGVTIKDSDKQPERWGTSWAFEALAKAAKALGTNLILTGVSIKSGGPNPYHESHHTGLDIDIHTGQDQVGIDNAQKQIRAFIDTKSVGKVFYNHYKGSKYQEVNIIKLKNHDNHVHYDIKVPEVPEAKANKTSANSSFNLQSLSVEAFSSEFTLANPDPFISPLTSVSTLNDLSNAIELGQLNSGNTNYNLNLSATPSIVPTDKAGNTLATAFNLGTLASSTQNDFVGNVDTVDYYRFTLTNLSAVTLNLSGLSADGDLELSRDQDGNGEISSDEIIQVSAATDNQDENINITALSAGDYFVKVSQYDGDTNYNLNLSATPSIIPPDKAGNTLATAFNLGTLASSTQNDFVGNIDTVDYYRFTLTNLSAVTLNLSGLSADGDLELSRDQDGNGEISSDEIIQVSEATDNQDENINITALSAGDYFVKVSQYDGDTNYNLNLSATPSIIPPDKAGNTLATAFNLGTLASSTQNDFVGNVDTVDYYRFTLTNLSAVTLNLSGLSADGDLELSRDQDGNGEISSDEIIQVSEATDNQDENINITALSAGDYFVKVSQYDGDTNYNFNLSATPSIIPPDKAGNTLATAFNLGTLASSTQNDFVGNIDTVDYYRFTLINLSAVTLNLSGLSADTDLELSLDQDGNGEISSDEIIQVSAATDNQDENINITALSAGDYFVKVSQYDGDTNYNLNLSATPSIIPPDKAGNTLATAFNLGTLASSTQNDFVGNIDTVDYYRFTLINLSAVTLNLSGLSADTDLELSLDQDGNGEISLGEIIQVSEATDNQDENINITTLPAGEYFVKVSKYNGDTNYNLKLSATPSIIPPDKAGSTLATAFNFGTLASSTQNDFVGNVDTIDYYRFTLTNPSRVTLNLSGLSTDGDLELSRDQDGNGEISSDEIIQVSEATDNQDENINITALPAGDYFVKVSQYDGDTNYRIALTSAISNEIPTLAIASTNATQTEGNSGTKSFTFTVTCTGDTTNSSSANWAVTGSGTNPADATDFVGTSGTVNFAAGETSKTITVNVSGDTTVEPDEGFTVTLSNPTNATISTGTATGTIQNDDTVITPTITLTVNPTSVAEKGLTNLVYTFTRTGVTSNTLPVNYTIGGTATNGSDYNTIGTTVTFAAGSSTATVTVDPRPDTIGERDETVTLTVTSGSGYTVGTNGVVTAVITNADEILDDVRKNPSVFMGKIRDYDGNDLGGSSNWKHIGDADVQGDGDIESIFVNPLIERWATVGVVNNFVNFSNHGQGGDTRVVGIYIDPTLKDRPENIGGPFDSQRRFKNDLRGENLRLLAAADYNKDGFQDMYFKVADGTAVLRALMHADGNIQYANYQSKADLTAFMTANNVSPSIWSGWI
ncbi:pre-peptidase C-terminal domain-containing protein [Cylindrospermopsis raciborskii G7]|uniref:pre-peptidase C-terminal domain-containing protein n=2 Tax=Cylindrospermopsis raciborskii TaxID=77022 RepID=UPI003EBCD113